MLVMQIRIQRQRTLMQEHWRWLKTVKILRAMVSAGTGPILRLKGYVYTKSFPANFRLVSLTSQPDDPVMHTIEPKSCAVATCHVNRQLSSSFVAGVANCGVLVSTKAVLAPLTHTLIWLTFRVTPIAVLKPTNERADYTIVQIAKRLLAVVPNKLFYNLQTRLSKKPVQSA